MFTKDDLTRCISVVADINHDMTPRQAFMDYMGHTECVAISIYPDGWKPHGEGSQSTFHARKDASGDYFVKDIEDGTIMMPMKEYKSLTDMLVAVMITGKEKL